MAVISGLGSGLAIPLLLGSAVDTCVLANVLWFAFYFGKFTVLEGVWKMGLLAIYGFYKDFISFDIKTCKSF